MSNDDDTARLTVPYVLRALANVWDNWCGLPEPVAMRANASNGIAGVDVADLAAVKAWNRALGGTNAPTSSLYPDRGPIHGVHVHGWNGWDVHIMANDEDGPRDPEGRTIVHQLEEVTA